MSTDRRSPLSQKAASLSGMFRLLNMVELAEHVGRHPQVIRKYYAAGVLPEPRHRIAHEFKTTRRWTLQEADAIAKLFDDVYWGKFAKIKRRRKRRKKEQTR